jgi:hypothetical protein
MGRTAIHSSEYLAWVLTELKTSAAECGKSGASESYYRDHDEIMKCRRSIMAEIAIRLGY